MHTKLNGDLQGKRISRNGIFREYCADAFLEYCDSRDCKEQEKKALHETIKGSGIYYLDECHYNNEFGLSLDKISEMTCYIS